jgi:hypothetical protein
LSKEFLPVVNVSSDLASLAWSYCSLMGFLSACIAWAASPLKILY